MNEPSIAIIHTFAVILATLSNNSCLAVAKSSMVWCSLIWHHSISTISIIWTLLLAGANVHVVHCHVHHVHVIAVRVLLLWAHSSIWVKGG